MKQKLFLVFLILTIFSCCFSLSVSAEETVAMDYERTYALDGVSYPLWEQDREGNYHPLIWYLNSENEMCSVWADGQTNESGAYVSLGCWEDQLSKMTAYESSGISYRSDLSFVIVNLNGVKLTHNGELYPLKYVHAKAFHTNETIPSVTEAILNENTVLKAIFLPDTLVHIGWSQGITNTMAAFYSFNNCTALEYVEFHPNTVFNDNTLNRGAFVNCSSLRAISLPNSIKIFGNAALAGCTSLTAVYLPSSLTTFSGAGNPFANSDNIYFVNDSFIINSVDDIPSKPETYCFPQGLTSFGAVALSPNANKIVVISEKVTSHSTKMFNESGVETVVYLGNMTSFALTKEQSTTLRVLMPNTTAEPEVSATGNTNGSAVYLCKLNKRYELDQNSWMDETVHIENPGKSVMTKEPNCADNAWKDTYCFCGVYIGEIEIENSNNIEKHDLENASIINIAYTDFSKTGCKTLKCERCGVENITEEASPLFICRGYSAPEFGEGGIAIGFVVNHDSIDQYEKVTNSTVEYGVFAIVKDRLGENDIFDEDGNLTKGAISANISSYDFDMFELRIVGFTDTQKDIKLAMGAYVAVTDGETTEYSYMQGGEPNENEKYCFVSYNDIVGKQLANAEVTQ